MNVYDYGQWYKFDFYTLTEENKTLKECIFTRDKKINEKEEVRKTMLSRGSYTSYHFEIRDRGSWRYGGWGMIFKYERDK